MRQTDQGEQLSAVRIVNDPVALGLQIEQAGTRWRRKAPRREAQERGDSPDAGALAAYVYERDGITGAGDQPISGEDLDDFVVSFRRREFDDAELPAEEAVAGSGEQEVDGPLSEAEAPSSVPARAAAQAAKEQRRPRVDAPIDEPPPAPAGAVEERVALTTVDRYYLAWVEYQQQRGAEPNGDDLSKYLGEKVWSAATDGSPLRARYAATCCPSGSTASGPSTECAVNSPR
ncbi:hypothetical protein [Streptomyces mirabilis]|uniref:hypothetical protein n=1 Tax=Streptomyces mirabilis TaxID=68239 RepID=UPI0036BC9767